MSRKVRRTNLNYSIFREKKSPFWYAQIRIEGHRLPWSTKIEATEANKEIALELARAEYFKVIKEEKLGIKEQQRLTLSQAFGTYRHHEFHKFSAGWKLTVNSAMDSLLGYFKPTTPFDQITTSGLTSYLTFRKDISNATKNRYMAILRRVINFLDNLDEFDVPRIKFKTLKLEEPDSRTTDLSREDFTKLYSRLPKHLQPIVLMALLTGLRKTNILTLDWKQVNLFTGIITVQVKSKKPGGKTLTIPISDRVKQLLLQLEPQKDGKIFLYRGKPIKSVKTAFNNARWDKEKEDYWLPDFRFHDLRHAFACWFLNSGGDLKQIQEALGHSSPNTTQKYARMKKETLKNAIDKVPGFSEFGRTLKVVK